MLNKTKTLSEVEKQLTNAQQDKEFDTSSRIEISNLSQQKIQDLELLGRVWGFLKYHHPAVTKGNYNWDYELFRILPKYLATADHYQRNALLISWIQSLGEIEKCKTCENIDDKAFIKPDLKWMESHGTELRDVLVNVYNNRSQGEQYYVEMVKGIKNPRFKNESSYARMKYLDDGFRLLTLYRYWNTVHYFFPSTYLTDKDWNTVLAGYIPKFVNAKTELEYEIVAIEMIGDVKDTHANLWGGADKINEWKGANYPPVNVCFIADKLVVIDYFNPELKEEVGLKIGDVITKINKVSVEQMIKDRANLYPASKHPTMLRNMALDFLRSNSKEIEIEFISDDSKVQIRQLRLFPKDSLNYYQLNKKTDEQSYKMLDNNIGYVTFNSIKEKEVRKIKKEFKNTKGIIIDIRNYPTAFMPFTLGPYFVSSTTPFVKFTKGNINNPGEFAYTKPVKIPRYGRKYKGKLIVLVNEITQSSAEYTAMAFRAGTNTTIIGSTTAGADGNISQIILPGGLGTVISGIGVYYPDGGQTQRIGIVPDIVVKPTLQGIREGRDELMEKAVEVIVNQ
jgi:C-terminal processing protease CtpA/Prc